jgi:hypothetical protein
MYARIRPASRWFVAGFGWMALTACQGVGLENAERSEVVVAGPAVLPGQMTQGVRQSDGQRTKAPQRDGTLAQRAATDPRQTPRSVTEDDRSAGARSETTAGGDGTVEGVVEALRLSEGQVVISTETGAVTLHAQPGDIAHIHTGDRVHMAFQDVEGERWLLPQQARRARYGTTITMAGNISNVDKRRGVISMGARTVRAHPAQIERIIPGQFLTLHYAQIGGEDWLTHVTPHMPKDDDPEPQEDESQERLGN